MVGDRDSLQRRGVSLSREPSMPVLKVDDEHQQPPSPARRIATWIEDHLAFATSIGGVLLVTTKLYVVSNYQVDTALAILGAASVVNLVSSTILLSLPLISLWALFLATVHFFASIEQRQTPNLGIVVVWIVGALFAPWFYVAAYSLVTLVAWGKGMHQKEVRKPSQTDFTKAMAPPGSVRRSSPFGSYGLLFLILPALMLLLDDRAWLPAEVMTTTSGSEIVGYAVSEGGDWMVVLDDRDRVIRYLESKSIRTRRVCRPRNPDPYFSQPSIAQIVFGMSSSKVGRCPAT